MTIALVFGIVLMLIGAALVWWAMHGYRSEHYEALVPFTWGFALILIGLVIAAAAGAVLWIQS